METQSHSNLWICRFSEYGHTLFGKLVEHKIELKRLADEEEDDKKKRKSIVLKPISIKCIDPKDKKC